MNQTRNKTDDHIIEEMNNHVFPSNTTGFRSLTKSEINEILNQILASYF